MSGHHVLVLASAAGSLINFRGPLLKAMVARGWRVTAVAPDFDAEVQSGLSAMGVSAVGSALQRTGTNPLADLQYHRSLNDLMRKLRPDALLAYTAKPVIWGSLAASAVGVPNIVAMITGLGYAFTPPSQPSLKHKAIGTAAAALYRLALSHAHHVFFQNPDDLALFRSRNLLQHPERTSVIDGSGVDLEYYASAPLPTKPTFLMIARLLRSKGVQEFADAAIRLKAEFPSVGFRLLGPHDHGPDAISAHELARWISDGLDYGAAVKDVRPALAAASVFVLPSYREGTPRSVLEAMAMGRPIITTDAPGCRETTRDGVNGYLIPPRSADRLADAMRRLIVSPELIAPMGAASLDLARTRYDVDKVNEKIMTVLSPATSHG